MDVVRQQISKIRTSQQDCHNGFQLKHGQRWKNPQKEMQRNTGGYPIRRAQTHVPRDVSFARHGAGSLAAQRFVHLERIIMTYVRF